jgi:hypothetical protein
MEANIITSLFKETIFVEETMEVKVVIDLAFPMLKVMDNLFSTYTYTTIHNCKAIKNSI